MPGADVDVRETERIGDGELVTVKQTRGSLRVLLRGAVHVMLGAWVAELMRECEGKRDKDVLDANVRLACNLHAHEVLLFRTLRPGELTLDRVQTLVCASLYLQVRH